MDSAVAVPSSVHHAMEATVAQLEGCRHDASLAAARELEGWRPVQRHFTLAVLGTVPARQREGLAGRTPRPSSADREGAGSFLETSSESNLAFYSTFAFEVIGHRRIGGGDPDVWRCSVSPRPEVARLIPSDNEVGAPEQRRDVPRGRGDERRVGDPLAALEPPLTKGVA